MIALLTSGARYCAKANYGAFCTIIKYCGNKNNQSSEKKISEQ